MRCCLGVWIYLQKSRIKIIVLRENFLHSGMPAVPGEETLGHHAIESCFVLWPSLSWREIPNMIEINNLEFLSSRPYFFKKKWFEDFTEWPGVEDTSKTGGKPLKSLGLRLEMLLNCYNYYCSLRLSPSTSA